MGVCNPGDEILEVDGQSLVNMSQEMWVSSPEKLDKIIETHILQNWINFHKCLLADEQKWI